MLTRCVENLFAATCQSVAKCPSRASAIGRYTIGVMLLAAICELAGHAKVISADVGGGRQGEAADPIAYFRTAENDALNCLYLQLRVLGYQEDYEKFRERVAEEPQPLSLLTLVSLGGKLGFRLASVKMTFADLAKAKAPVIVHLEEREIGRGSFCLFLGMDQAQTSMLVIDGDYVVRTWMPRDQFRRDWTGYAVIARPSIAWGLWVRRSATALFLVVGGVAVRLRGRVENLGRWWVLRVARGPR